MQPTAMDLPVIRNAGNLQTQEKPKLYACLLVFMWPGSIKRTLSSFPNYRMPFAFLMMLMMKKTAGNTYSLVA